MFVIAACCRRYSGSTSRWHIKEYGHFKLALREGLASSLASFWKFERDKPFLHSHASLGSLPGPSEWAIIYAGWYVNLIDLNGRLLTDYVGRYEHLDRDFKKICHRLQIPSIDLPHKRVAKDRENYRSYYTSELIDLVSRHFAKDIALLKYQFE